MNGKGSKNTASRPALNHSAATACYIIKEETFQLYDTHKLLKSLIDFIIIKEKVLFEYSS